MELGTPEGIVNYASSFVALRAASQTASHIHVLVIEPIELLINLEEPG
jgi:hypothetical protein